MDYLLQVSVTCWPAFQYLNITYLKTIAKLNKYQRLTLSNIISKLIKTYYKLIASFLLLGGRKIDR